MAHIAEEYAAVLKDIALMRHELHEIASELTRLADRLKAPENVEDVAEYLSPLELQGRCDRLRERLEDRKRLERTMHDAGLAVLIRGESEPKGV